MALARLIVIGIGTVLLGLGYFMSQMSYFKGSTANYVASLDESPVPLLALGLVVASVVLAFVREEGEEE